MNRLIDLSKEKLQKMLDDCKEKEAKLHKDYYNIKTRDLVSKEYKSNQRLAIRIAATLRDYDREHTYVKPNVYNKNIITGEMIKSNSVMRKDMNLKDERVRK